MALVHSVPPDWAERPAAAAGLSVQLLSWTSEETKFISSQAVNSWFEALRCSPNGCSTKKKKVLKKSERIKVTIPREL